MRVGGDLKRLGRTDVMIPSIGLGTWGIGGGYWVSESGGDREAIEALRYGVRLGMWLIDTAEMYGAGRSEEIVGRAVSVFDREEVFIVTKVWPSHLRYDDLLRAARGSLRRLGTGYIDLYLIHAPNPSVPISESMRAMEKLVEDGVVRFIGVSNFSVREMEEARAALSRHDIVVNQVKYSILDRRVELDVLPYCQREGITLMAYTPIERGEVARYRVLQAVGERYGKTAIQVALNWLIYQRNVVAIVKSTNKRHLEENAGAMGWRLSREDWEYLSRQFR